MKTTKLFLLTFFLISSFVAFSQGPGGERHEKIKARKVAIITERLDLSVEEAQKFWPVYNEMEEKRDEIVERKKKAMEKLLENPEMTDEELEKTSQTIIQAEVDEAALRAEYHDKFKEVLPIRKVAELYRTEHHFMRELLRDIRGGGRGPGPHNGPPPGE